MQHSVLFCPQSIHALPLMWPKYQCKLPVIWSFLHALEIIAEPSNPWNTKMLPLSIQKKKVIHFLHNWERLFSSNIDTNNVKSNHIQVFSSYFLPLYSILSPKITNLFYFLFYSRNYSGTDPQCPLFFLSCRKVGAVWQWQFCNSVEYSLFRGSLRAELAQHSAVIFLLLRATRMGKKDSSMFIYRSSWRYWKMGPDHIKERHFVPYHPAPAQSVYLQDYKDFAIKNKTNRKWYRFSSDTAAWYLYMWERQQTERPIGLPSTNVASR